jgi:hypothetical protein
LRFESLNGRNLSEDLAVHKRIILKRDLETVRMWTVNMLLRIGTGDGLS